jgi:hypothetical protein
MYVCVLVLMAAIAHAHGLQKVSTKGTVCGLKACFCNKTVIFISFTFKYFRWLKVSFEVSKSWLERFLFHDASKYQSKRGYFFCARCHVYSTLGDKEFIFSGQRIINCSFLP